MKKAIVREVISAYESWCYELREKGFTPDDFTFNETIEAIMDKVDHKKFK